MFRQSLAVGGFLYFERHQEFEIMASRFAMERRAPRLSALRVRGSRRPLVESLERRDLPAGALGVFGVIDAIPGESSARVVAVSPHDFRLPRSGKIGLRIVESSRSTTGAVSASPLASVADGAPTVLWVGPGSHALSAPATSPSGGSSQTQIAVLGDVNGDFRVDQRDLLAIRKAEKAQALVASADIDGDGRVDATDLGLARANLGAATSIRPLAVSASPAQKASGLTVRSSEITLRLAATAGARLSVANWSTGSAVQTSVARASGRPKTSVDLALGANRVVVTATDRFGQRTSTEVTVNRLRTPVILLPGYITSVPILNAKSKPLNALRALEYAFHRGRPASKLVVVGYDKLDDALHQAGYVDNVDLFHVPYDERLPLARTDGKRDAVLSRETARALTKGVVRSQVEYLGRFLAKLVKSDPTITSVDVIGHSNGNIVTRAYVQSAGYGGKFSSGLKKYRLPKVDRFVQLAAPSNGAVLAWNPWNDNLVDLDPLKKYLPALTVLYRAVTHGVVIPGPDHVISRASILDRATGKPSPEKFFRQYLASLRTLNPTFDFLYDLQGNLTNINNDPASASDALLDLNAESKPGDNPWLSLVGSAFLSYGVTVKTYTHAITHIGTGGMVISVNSKGQQVPTAPGQIWYEMVPEDNSGDGVVPTNSLESTFPGDSRIELRAWGQTDSPTPHLPYTPTSGPVDHTLGMITNKDILDWVVNRLLDPYYDH